MSYKLYDVAQGSFAIDWDTCCQIIRSYYRADLQSKYAEEKTESQASTLNPLSWGLPDLTFIVVDWARVGAEARSNVLMTAYKLAAFAMFQSGGIDAMVRELKRMQLETRRLNAAFSDRMRKASHKSWMAMEQSVATYQSRVNEAKLIRDLSGSVLIGASTAATGGASAAAIGGMGTILKTTAKYQDTGNAGVAALEATQNIVCTVIPGANQVAMGKVVKTIISTSADTGKALLEGESLGTAIAVGAVNIPVAAGSDQSKKALQKVLGKTVVSVIVKVTEDQTKKFVQDKIKGKVSSSSMAQDARVITSDDLAERLSLENDLLLKLAVVDMSKGVGWSWW